MNLLTDFSNRLTQFKESQQHTASELVGQLFRNTQQPVRQEPEQQMAPPNPSLRSRSLISNSTQNEETAQEVQVSANLTFANSTQVSGLLTTSRSALSPSNQGDQTRPQTNPRIDQQQSLRRTRCFKNCTIS